MPRIIYVNGSYAPYDDALVHVEDRGFQFADGVYEMIAYMGGRFVDEEGHLDRLERSLAEVDMDMPVARHVLKVIMREVLRRNRLKNAAVYLQVTRGHARRDFKFPQESRPSLVVIARSHDYETRLKNMQGVKVVTIPDLRWKRRDIKTIALLPQVLGKQRAVCSGAAEGWMVDDEGYITEGTSCNAWVIDENGVLRTRKATHDILRGVTRTAIVELLKGEGIEFDETPFTPEEAYRAKEAFSTSSAMVMSAVTQIDDAQIGDGSIGPVTQKVLDLYLDYAHGLKGEDVRWTA